jgi:regulatory protein
MPGQNEISDDTESAKVSALRLVGRAEQSSFGLSHKLRAKGFSRFAISEVIRSLAEDGIVDDFRFAVMWTRSRIRRKVESPRNLILQLQSRGISSKIAHSAVQSILEDDELDLLQQYIEKIDHTDALRETLRYEGFSADSIEKLII